MFSFSYALGVCPCIEVEFCAAGIWFLPTKQTLTPCACIHTHLHTDNTLCLTGPSPNAQKKQEVRRKKWPQVHKHTSTYTPLIPSDFQIELECSLTSVQVCVCLETITWHASPLLPKNQEAPYRSCHHLSLSLYCLFSCTCSPPDTHTFKANSFFV